MHALRATFAVSPRTMAPQKKGAGKIQHVLDVPNEQQEL